MTRRTEIEQTYKVGADGRITSPGKFEGEPLYVVHFWDFYLDGCDDVHMIDGTYVSRFEVSDEERAEFPELAGAVWVDLWESEQGFVYSRTYDAGEALPDDDDSGYDDD
jgi:hypothetical protein